MGTPYQPSQREEITGLAIAFDRKWSPFRDELVEEENSVVIQVAIPQIGQLERDAVLRVLDSGMLAQGPEVAAFETEFANHVSDRPCVAVNSGTSALHLALLALGIGPGDEVIVPSFSFAATANSVCLAGATPVFVDIEVDHFCIEPSQVEAALTDRTRAVMPVHLYGHPADLSALADIVQRHGLLLIEDSAQAHLATWDGVPVGAWGDCAAFSFYPTKNMTSGEGGMVTCASEATARQVRLLRNQGMERRYENEIIGFNNRMTDIHAAIGRAQLTQLAGWTTKRRENAAFLSSHLVGVVVPPTSPRAEHVFHQYTIRIESGSRDEFAAALQQRGVGSGVYYPTPIHRLPSFNLDLDLPVTQQVAQTCLSLPVHPALTDADLEGIVAAVNAVAEKGC